MGVIIYKTDDQIELIRQSCILVCKTLAHVGSLMKPGAYGYDLDKAAETFIRDNGAVPGFKGYKGFPSTLCFSPNEVVVHGIPNKETPLKEGDIISVDCGVLMNGYYGDAAYTFALGDPTPEITKLLRITLDSLYIGISQVEVGKRIGDIGFAIQQKTERENGYGVVKDLVGHGVGRNLHEAPEVPNFGKRGTGVKMQHGLVIAIEPMINMGRKDVRSAKDGWTIYTRDKKPSAHFEHTVALRKTGVDILSDHSFIEDAIAANPHLSKVTLAPKGVPVPEA